MPLAAASHFQIVDLILKHACMHGGTHVHTHTHARETHTHTHTHTHTLTHTHARTRNTHTCALTNALHSVRGLRVNPFFSDYLARLTGTRRLQRIHLHFLRVDAVM